MPQLAHEPQRQPRTASLLLLCSTVRAAYIAIVRLDSSTHWRRRSLPLGNPADQIWIAFVADERPAFFVSVGRGLCFAGLGQFALDQRLGVLHVPVDRLDGCADAVFLLES